MIGTSLNNVHAPKLIIVGLQNGLDNNVFIGAMQLYIVLL